jgi:thiol:disulfide interchange protein
MVQHWILREPSLAFGFPVYIFATILFPLHLGWIGTSLFGLACYLVAAAMIFSLADASTQRGPYPRFVSVIPQLFLSLLALVVPALLAFAIGSILGPIDEAQGDAVCASRGAGESDSIEAGSDDAFDLTADCIGIR